MLIGPVYLAGGMHTDWRSRVIAAFPDIIFFDPSSHGLTDEADYTTWDLAHVRYAETVFVYMDAANPSGYGLSLEAGYAFALNKRIIFVDESGTHSRSFGMLRQIADVVYSSMDEAINSLGGVG